MALASFRSVHSKNGSGRFVVSEGIAPSEYLLPHESLPTLYTDLEDDRFEIVVTKGTLLSVVQDANLDSRIVPANGAATWTLYEVGEAPSFHVDEATAIAAAVGTDFVVVPPASTVIGAAQYDLYRPFDKGTSQGAGWITHGYVEWPLVAGVNATGDVSDLLPGTVVVADEIGRPVAAVGGEGPGQIVGKAIVNETFVENFDDGLLSYMQLPSDPGAVREVYALTEAGPYEGRLGIRANLDVANVVGAVRVNLTL